MQRIALTLLVPVFLSACASGGPGYVGGAGGRPAVAPAGDAPVNPLARSATYTCELLSTVVLTEGQPDARVTFNSGLTLSLARQPDVLGLRFGAPPYQFLVRGAEATLLNDGKPERCRAR
jgi:hypothetical protein